MSRRQFAIRLACTKDFVAIVPVNINAGRTETQVEALLWNELDKDVNPFDYEYAPVHYIEVPEATGRWLIPRAKVKWKAFSLTPSRYYEILSTKGD